MDCRFSSALQEIDPRNYDSFSACDTQNTIRLPEFRGSSEQPYPGFPGQDGSIL